jgi:lipopolysaccharide/colanic/teichoic acid biosynthesis glycosyltransferase
VNKAQQTIAMDGPLHILKRHFKHMINVCIFFLNSNCMLSIWAYIIHTWGGAGLFSEQSMLKYLWDFTIDIQI